MNSAKIAAHERSERLVTEELFCANFAPEEIEQFWKFRGNGMNSHDASIRAKSNTGNTIIYQEKPHYPRTGDIYLDKETNELKVYLDFEWKVISYEYPKDEFVKG